MLKNYFLTAWRNIIRNKVFAFINILGLTLGICTCVVIFPVIRYELSFDNFHPDGKYIYRIGTQIRSKEESYKNGIVPPPLLQTAPKETSGWEMMAPCYMISDSVLFTYPSWFGIFAYQWLAGDPARALNSPFSVVLSEKRARQRFGNISLDKIMGKELIYRDSLRVTVTGIVKDWEGNTDFPYTDFISFSTIPVSFVKNEAGLDQWGDDGFFPGGSRAFVKLPKDVSPATLESQLSSLAKGRSHLKPGQELSFFLQPLSDIHSNKDVWDGAPKMGATTEYILAGIAVFILLLAVINFINLSTALSTRRAREVGIRKVMGSSRSALTLQFLIETGILILFSMLLAVLLVHPILHLFHTMIPARLRVHIFSYDMLLFLVVITGATTLLSGLYPARILSSWLPALCLKGNAATTGNRKWGLRKSLIVFQFTISLIFIISTIIVGRQIEYMTSQDMGFSTDAIISIDTGIGDTTRRAGFLAERLKQVPGVSMIARQSFPPISDYHTMIPLRYKDNPPIPSALQTADSNFLPLYNMKLLAGENLHRPAKGISELVINESMVQAMGLTDPHAAIGQFLNLGNSRIPIIGVVADYHEYSFHEKITPIAIANVPAGESGIAVKLATNGKSLQHFQYIIAGMEKEWKAVYPGSAFNYSFLDDAIQRLYEKEKETIFLLSAAMGITIFISCMGLFGLSMFTARQRAKEVGIRKVLGASVADISILLSRNVIGLVALSAVIASPIAWYGTQLWLRDFAYRVRIGPWIFVAAGLAALMIALLTISFQTIKTALINPAETLRTE